MSIPTDITDNLRTEINPQATREASSDRACEAYQKRVALVGRFGGMNQREAANVLRSMRQLLLMPLPNQSTGWCRADEPPIPRDQILNSRLKAAAAAGELEILHETELWQRLGLVDVEQSIRRYHTPAMLAHLLGVSVQSSDDGIGAVDHAGPHPAQSALF